MILFYSGAGSVFRGCQAEGSWFKYRAGIETVPGTPSKHCQGTLEQGTEP